MKDTNLPQRLVRKRAMANIISVSPRKLDDLMKKRIVPFSRIDGLILFDPQRVVEAITAYERKTAK
jgi:hypothetical protein